jgi:ankyrin repeat protein
MLFLIDNGADINYSTAKLFGGKSLLLDACMKGHVDLVDFLLKKGAEVNVKCVKGRTLGEYIRCDYLGKTQAMKK